MQRENQIAYHEAAHAVAMIRHGRKFDGVTIESDSEFEGRLWGSGGLSMPSQEIVAHLAGYAANIRLEPEAETAIRRGSQDDFELVAFHLGFVDDPDLDKWIQEAGEFVAKNWKAIEAVAAELRQCRTLNGENVEALVRSADAAGDE